MGLVEELAAAVLADRDGGDRDAGQVGALVRAAVEALGGADDEGVGGLASRFERAGQRDVFGSWVGTGQNRSIGADVLSQILRGHPLERAPERAGLGGAAGGALLAKLLPMLIDKLTPQGQVPPAAEIRRMGDDMQRGGSSPFARPEMSFMSSGDKPKKPDFSNVTGGASSTAPGPAPAAEKEARTYTVVSGDNLSKIAKRFYGDANQWKKIFEANRDKLKDPDLIHPGQVLRIPE